MLTGSSKEEEEAGGSLKRTKAEKSLAPPLLCLGEGADAEGHPPQLSEIDLPPDLIEMTEGGQDRQIEKTEGRTDQWK